MKKKQKYIEAISTAKIAAQTAKKSIQTIESPEAKKVIQSLTDCLEAMTNVFALFGSPHTPPSKVGSVLGDLKKKSKSDKKKGGGTLKKGAPDQVIRHPLTTCQHCHNNLSDVQSCEDQTRQEVSVKVQKIFIDHIVEV